MKDKIKYSDKLAHEYSKFRNEYTATDEKFFSILEKINIKNKEILDFGCGDGRYSLKFSELGAKNIIGIDISSTMIKLAKENLKLKKISNVGFIESDGNNLPFEKDSFDFVFAYFVLHHFKNTLKPLKEISRVLKNNSYLLATFNTFQVKEGEENIFKTIIPIKLGQKNSIIVHIFINSDGEIKNNLEEVGFKIIK